MMTVLTLRVVATGEIERKPFRCQEVVMGQLGHGVCGGGVGNGAARVRFPNDASFLVWVMW